MTNSRDLRRAARRLQYVLDLHDRQVTLEVCDKAMLYEYQMMVRKALLILSGAEDKD